MIHERQETEEELEKRKKEQEEKKQAMKDVKKKPAGKMKEEVPDDMPQVIKEIRLTNIDMSGYYPFFSKWIASQLQIIKDRGLKDVYSDKPVYTKIYPQIDGFPVYNKSGRYWVKLYYMGRERKIEIDDRMPTNVKNNCLLPRSVKKEEIWPMILAKAFMKLTSLTNDVISMDNEFGDGSVIYALTGLVPETLSIPKLLITSDDWNYVKEVLKDHHFTNNTVFVTCFCSAYHKPIAPSNKLSTEKEALMSQITYEKKMNPEEEVDVEPMKTSTILNKEASPSSPKGKFMRKISPTKNKTTIELPLSVNTVSISKEKPTYIIPGFAYSIMESFYTDGFNMVFVQKHSEKEIKLIQEYLDLTKINIHKKEKEEKLEIRRKRKDLREKIKEDAEKRKELMEKPPSLYRFFRVKTAIAKVPVLNIMTPFTADEIFLAKKCILNKLKCPPNYDLPDIKFTADDKSVYSVSQQGEAVQIKPLEDFSTLPNIKEPMKRGVGGTWILDKDFISCFEYLQIFYNPVKLCNHKVINVQPTEAFELTNNSDCEVVVIEENVDGTLDTNALFQGQFLPFIVTFSPMKAVNGPLVPSPYCIVQKFQFDNLETVKNFRTLKENIDSLHILLENKNHVFRIMVNSPLGYTIWLSCLNSFKVMSISDYLTKYEGFTSKCFNIEYPALDKERYHLYFKYKISNIEKSHNLIIRIKTSSETYLLKYLRFRLTDLQQSLNDSQLEGVQHEGVYLYPEEQVQELLDYNKFFIKQGSSYTLLLESRLPNSFPEGQFEVEILYKGSLNIDIIENLEPFEYMDRYQPNKYGIIFRERLFLTEELHCTLCLRLTQMLAKDPSSVNPKEKSNKKPNANENDSNQEIEMSEKRLIFFELFENERLITQIQGINTAILAQLCLKPNKDESLNRNYYLQARFELRDWPGCIQVCEETKCLAWVLKVFTSEPLAFVRDTQKEDYERSIRKSWEDKEPGRSEKAKKSRQKYLLLLKKESGQPLTEQENELLNEPRLSKKQREEETAAKLNPKGRSPMKQDKKAPPAGKGVKKEEVVVEEKKERPLPVSKDHSMIEIKDFLTLLENQRVIEERPMHSGLIEVRSSENKNELKEGFLMGKEDFISSMKLGNEVKEQLKILQNDNKKSFNTASEQRRKEFFDQITLIGTKEREEVKKIVSFKREKEKAILDLVALEKGVNAEELEKILIEIESNGDLFNKEISVLGRKALVNAKIMAITEKLNNAVSGFDLPIIQSCLDDITKNNMIIDEEVIEKAFEIVEEAKNNPNYIAEKQAELKKTAKKPAGNVKK